MEGAIWRQTDLPHNQLLLIIDEDISLLKGKGILFVDKEMSLASIVAIGEDGLDVQQRSLQA